MMDSVTTFLDMGGYALYVWLAYGAALVILVPLFIISRGQEAALEAELNTLKAQAPHRRAKRSEAAQ